MRNPFLHVVETALDQSAACIAQCIDTIQYGRQQYLVFTRLANNTVVNTATSGSDGLYDVENEDDPFDAFDDDDEEDETAAGGFGDNIGVFGDFFHEQQQPQAMALSTAGSGVVSPSRKRAVLQQQTAATAKSIAPVMLLTHFVAWQNHDRTFKRAIKRMKRRKCPSSSASTGSTGNHHPHRRHRHRLPAMLSSEFVHNRPIASSRSNISWLQI